MIEEIKDIIEVLRVLERFLPEGGTEFVFNLLLKSNIKNVVLKSNALGLFLKSAIAGFIPEDKTITIDMDAVKKIKKPEGVLFLLCHEIAHSLPQIGGSEERANQWAYEQFIKFKRS